MNQNASYQKETRLTTARGPVRVRSFCNPEEIRSHHLDAEFGTHAQFKSLYTRRESLESDAINPDANIVLALSEEDHIIGFAVLAYPDDGERWLDLGPGLMIELRVIEVCRSWRSARLGHALLRIALEHPHIEDKIAYMVGYAWTWDLDGTARRAQEYRQILIRLFEAEGFAEYETNEPNICLKQENLFMCRVGRHVPEEVVDRFNWLRFGIVPEIETALGDGMQPSRRLPAHDSIFTVLKDEGLTFLGIYHDWKKGRVSLRAAAEWDPVVDWSGYNDHFSIEHPLISNTHYLGYEDTLKLFERYRLGVYLEDIINRMKKSRHLGLECYLEPRRDIQVLNFMHSNALAKGALHHALRSGGICYFDDTATELEILVDGLHMSRTASFKNAGAQLPFGGCRIAVRARALTADDRAVLGFVAYVLDRTRAVVGPDLGFPAEIVDVIRREGYSANIVGGFEGVVGSPSQPTAYGVYLALKEAAYAKYGSLSLVGRKIVVQGVGAVGSVLVEKYLAPAQADIYVCDIKPLPLERLQTKLAGQVTIIDPGAVLEFEGDALVPCGKASVLDAETIGRLRYGIVLGAAGNTLGAVDPEEEIRLSRMMHRRGILFQADWIHNAAGVIVLAETYLYRNEASLERVVRQVERVCRDGVRENLKAARASGVAPTEQAYQHYNALIYA